jgi:multicomponent Na+:H+ antiporter subunit A
MASRATPQAAMSPTASAHHGDSGPSYLWTAALPLSLFLLLIWGLQYHPLPWSYHITWIDSLDVSLAFRIDGLAAQMLVLITGIGTLVFLYASGYLAHEPHRGRLFAVLLSFMVAMIGAVTADNLILLFVFWELTSLTSFLLVGFKHEDIHARAAARQALLVTMGGGLALLGGLLLLGQMAHTWSIKTIVTTAPALVSDPRLPYALLLVFIGAFTKSAQFPFHFWLPNAMSAPTPVSAYLHSATMVKLGIYLLARLDAGFNHVTMWEETLVSIGTITAVWAAILTLRERDLKRILARSTVAALGTLTLLIGLPSPGAGLAVTAFLFAHALYKAPLFMVAGNIDHATGTRSIDHLMGLRRFMPWTAATAVLAGLSMAGLPLSFGFVAKGAISAAKSQAELFAVVSYATVLVNAVAVAVAAVAAIRVFWGPPEAPRGRVHEVSWRMLLPPLLIVLLGIEFEFLPNYADPLLFQAARAISPDIGPLTTAGSYALGSVVSLTAITAIIGLLLFLSWDRLHRLLHAWHWLDRYGAAAWYERLLHGLPRLAAWQTRGLQHGRLNGYMRLLLTALLLMAGWLCWYSGIRPSLDWRWPPYAWGWGVACLLIVAGAGAALVLRQRLAMLMASGLVGYGSAILFLFAGAPDLAFTQFAVETVLVVIAASVLPLYRYDAAPPARLKVTDIALATAAGIGTFLVLSHLDALPVNSSLAEWFKNHSLSEAHGRNVVNVIIVDFRALDTLGEIAVLAFSLLAALPLLTGLKRKVAP